MTKAAFWTKAHSLVLLMLLRIPIESNHVVALRLPKWACIFRFEGDQFFSQMVMIWFLEGILFFCKKYSLKNSNWSHLAVEFFTFKHEKSSWLDLIDNFFSYSNKQWLQVCIFFKAICKAYSYQVTINNSIYRLGAVGAIFWPAQPLRQLNWETGTH